VPDASSTLLRPATRRGKTVALPLIINGERQPVTSRTAHYELEYEVDLTVRLPTLESRHIALLRQESGSIRHDLAELSVYDIASFLSRAASVWLEMTAGGPLDRVAQTSELTGYPEAMIRGDYESIAHFMSIPTNIYDLVTAELGAEKIMDEWLPVLSSYIRAFPYGLLVHYLVGNLPLASLFSIIRGVITRNQHFAKVPSRDPITAITFMEALIEVDPQHPIARSLSAGYWPHGDGLEAEILGMADVVSAWGGEQALAELRGRIPVGVPTVEYGPRWSASVVDLTQVDARKAAYRLASDVCYYDQEACFSTQRAFVRGDVDALVGRLQDRLEAFSRQLPKTTAHRDALAHRSACLLECSYLGWQVHSGADWAIVIVPDPAEALEHPLGRTVIIHPLDDLRDVERYLNKKLQGLSVFPFGLALDYRDRWVRAGADRIVELGTSRRPRQGFTHDGTRGLSHLVRFACTERPLGEHVRRDWMPLPELERSLFVVD
jgi:long-chain-fatty-acyl-CoA reductase